MDIVVDQGDGPAAVRRYFERNRRRHRALVAVHRARQLCQPVTYGELIAVADLWVETALGLDVVSLRTMDRLARTQPKCHRRAAMAVAGRLT